MRRMVLLAMALVACKGTEVTSPATDEPQGMVRVIPPDGAQSVGGMHNEALAWVLADLQIAKRRLGASWDSEDMQPTVAQSEARFLKYYPKVNKAIYHRIKFDKLSGMPLTTAAITDSAALIDVRSIEVASTMYWEKMAPEWNKLLGGTVFTSVMFRQSGGIKRLVGADIAGAIAGFYVGGPSGVIPGAAAASIYEAIMMILESVFRFSLPLEA